MASDYHHQEAEDDGMTPSKFWRGKNFIPAKTFSDTADLPTRPSFRKLPEYSPPDLRVQPT